MVKVFFHLSDTELNVSLWVEHVQTKTRIRHPVTKLYPRPRVRSPVSTPHNISEYLIRISETHLPGSSPQEVWSVADLAKFPQVLPPVPVYGPGIQKGIPGIAPDGW